MNTLKAYRKPRRTAATSLKQAVPKYNQQKSKKSWMRYVQEYVQEFFEQTSVHGFRHVMVTTRHPVELVLWLVVIVASVAFSVLLCRSSWERYKDNPTVVSMEKDYRSWQVDFPAATICYLDRLNRIAAATYIENTWGKVDANKFNYYMSFLNEVTNISYNNLDKFEKFANDPKLAKVNLTKVVLEVQMGMSHTMEHKDATLNEVAVFTEFGLCYTGQSAIAHHFTAVPADPSVKQPRFIPHTICDLESYCSSKYEYQGVFIYAIHSPFEMIDINTAMLHPPRHWLMDTNFKYLSAVASDSLRRLKPAQRRCNFADEAQDIGLPLYSYHLCQTVCRKRAIQEQCGCIPLFYARMGGGKLCDLKGLACVGKLVERVTETACSCRPLCEDVYFTKDKEMETLPRNETTNTGGFASGSYVNPTATTWRLLFVTKFRLMRDVVFSFADLLVSFGGTAGLFLGCSLLSGVEVVYFFTLRLFFHVYKNLRKSP